MQTRLQKPLRITHQNPKPMKRQPFKAIRNTGGTQTTSLRQPATRMAARKQQDWHEERERQGDGSLIRFAQERTAPGKPQCQTKPRESADEQRGMS